MKKPGRADRKRNSALRRQPRQDLRKFVFLFLVGALLLVTGFWLLKSKEGLVQPSSSYSAGAQKGFQRLKGRWHRSDAGYVIDIKGVDDTGRMEASYFNPRSIQVARAEASRQGAQVRVAIELRDEGYPGSTYELTYDASGDVLRGKYYQAALKETFDVVFVKRS